MTFFSGTDTATLREEGTDRNHFVSLIVNNAGIYTAGITKKIKSVRDITETFSYSTYEGQPVTEDKIYQETSESIMWYELDIDKHDAKSSHQDLIDRIKEIKKSTESNNYKYQYPYSNTIGSIPSSQPSKFISWQKEYEPVQSACKQTSLFDNEDDDVFSLASTYRPVDTLKSKVEAPATPKSKFKYEGTYNEDIVMRAVKQLITGNVILPDEDTIDIESWAKNMVPLYQKRFGDLNIPANKVDFESWVMAIVDYVMQSELDPALIEMEEDQELSQKAFDIICVLDSLEKNPYLNMIIEEVSNFIQ